MRAQDLNLPFSTGIEHIHVINGKTGIDIHIVKALLSKAGCTWRCLKDCLLYTSTSNIIKKTKLMKLSIIIIMLIK